VNITQEKTGLGNPRKSLKQKKKQTYGLKNISCMDILPMFVRFVKNGILE